MLIERAGHNPHDEQTAQVIRAVRDFMADVNPSRA
jgi:pimeloyl-ACP methyl ester carboxylesterase